MKNGSKVRRSEKERGAELIEVAITLPILLLISVGIFEFGRAFQTWEVLTNASREAARVAILPSGDAAAAEARARDYMRSGALDRWDDADISVDPATVDLGGGNTANASRVTVSYPFSFIVLSPVARLVNPGSTLGNDLTITTSTTMRNESQ